MDTGSQDGRGDAKIEMSAMDGTGRTAIVTDSLGLPRCIAVDHAPGELEGRIYWTDESYRKIESASLNGSDRVTVIGGWVGGCDQSRHIAI